MKAHTEDDIQVTGDVHAHHLDSHPTLLVRALQYIGEPPTFNFHGALRTVRDVHGLWDHTMLAARFAKLVE